MNKTPITNAAAVHVSRAAFHPYLMDWVVPKSTSVNLELRIQQLEDVLAEIYHSTSCTEGQLRIIEEVLPQSESENVTFSTAPTETP